jgi:hypothetical protein
VSLARVAAGPLHIVAVGQVGGVDHDRGDPEACGGADRLVDQVGVLEVVEVNGDIGRGLPGDVRTRRDKRCEATAVEPHSVLADLHQHRNARVFCAGRDALGMFGADDVECQHGSLSSGRRVEQVGGVGKAHGARHCRAEDVCNMRRS